MNQRLAMAAGVLVSVLPLTAVAQPAPPPGQPRPLPAQAAPANPDIEPRLPEVSDPMLTPPPPAPNVLNSWQQALTLVRSRSTELRTATARIEEAEGARRLTLSGALPTLTGVGALTHHLLKGEATLFDRMTGMPIGSTTVPQFNPTWQVGLGLRVPVLAPQAWYDAGTGSRRVRAAKLSAEETERQVLGDVALAIVQVVTGERAAEISRVSLRSALQNLDLNQRRQRLGAATAVDVLRAQEQVEASRAQLVANDETLRQTRELLGVALGTYEAWGVRPDIHLDRLAADARSSCRIQPQIDTRSDIRAAEANVETARRDVSSVDWSYAPNVDFVSDLTYLSHNEISPNNEHVTWTIGGLLTWTLYDGGLRYGQKSINKARVKIAEEQLTTAKRQARLELVQTQRGVVVAEARLEVSRRQRDVLRETSRLARVAFVNGSGTSFELNDTERQLREAELDTALKEFDVMRAKIAALLASSNCDV